SAAGAEEKSSALKKSPAMSIAAIAKTVYRVVCIPGSYDFEAFVRRLTRVERKNLCPKQRFFTPCAATPPAGSCSGRTADDDRTRSRSAARVVAVPLRHRGGMPAPRRRSTRSPHLLPAFFSLPGPLAGQSTVRSSLRASMDWARGERITKREAEC